MGVISQPAWRREPERDAELPIPSTGIENLFYEFLSRYEALRRAKRRELFWLLLTGMLGMMLLFLPWLAPIKQLWPSLITLLLFNLAIHNYFKIKSLVSHSYINAQILHYHLVSRIEVGFCNHGESCRCADDFRHYVWKKYHISIYSNRFEVNL